MRSPEFEAYIGPARLYPQVWRLLMGICLIVFVYISSTALIMAGIFGFVGPMGFFAWLTDIKAMNLPAPTLVLLLTFAGLALGTIIAAPACHYRGPGTLFGPASDTLRGFFTALAVALPILGGAMALGAWFYPAVPNLKLDEWLGYLPFALPLILIQTTSEELLFRGYLQQQLAARFRSRAVWMVLPSALFAALHWDPTTGSNSWLILAATFAFGMIAADLTEQTGSLGAAMGLHFINNVLALLIVTMDDKITGLALYVTPFGADDTSVAPLALGVDIVVLLILWRLLRAVLNR